MLTSSPAFVLRVDHVSRAALALPGRLGLTRAPGRPGPGRSPDPGAWLHEDLVAIAGSGGKVLVSLLEPVELAQLGDVGQEAERAGLTWVSFPIPDLWIPSDPDAARRLVHQLVRTLERGHDVVVHCWGGLGRSGTIAACVLVATGHAPARAIAHVRAARPGAVQNDAQERFVHDFAALALLRRFEPPWR